ncbi:sulfate ABC transporter ATP-binding isoform B [Chlorella sorokiniana]|uniref:Sulfate ABC transporter ATP-binding isoform B n=1 Tax=Chlorella sorokiniana TaxID=3076 RepID=A0A2P6TYN9_CHLSO|nr:sulfate ABC transporter ATP-binding isoform B [Chlorella sorokiniana]|eukprot:PRW59185.1 sulfate ABC transporter ATP-binding isoform B [Chlorella sorokiniana]
MAWMALAGFPPVLAVQQRRLGASPAAQQPQPFVQHAARLQPRPAQRRAGPVLASAEAAAAPQQSAQPPAATAQQQQEQQQAAAAGQPSIVVHGAQVAVQDMVKHFQTRRGMFKAVNGVDVTMEPGTITALLGPSGSGKTTLLRLIAGLEEPTAGRVLFDGEDVTEYGVQDRDLGFVFQGYALFKHMTVADNITFGPRMRKMDIDCEKRVEELLELTGLQGLGGRFPPQLSGGQRQRVAMARALACNPRLMLLDEPFGALDPIVRKSLRNGLRDIVKRIGVTTVIVTHDQEEAWDIADQVVIFNKGLIEQQGTPEEVGRAPASPFVMNFVGDVNHLPASSQLVRKMSFHTDKPFVMCRPSDITVHTNYESPEAAASAAASVHDKQNMGKVVRYYLRFDDGVDIDFTVPRRQDEEQFDLDVGQRVYVSVPPERMMGFDYSEVDGSAVTA